MEVDNFEEGKRIPSCQLIAMCEAEQPTTLEHLVTLSGAKKPHNTFTIYRPYDSSGEYNPTTRLSMLFYVCTHSLFSFLNFYSAIIFHIVYTVYR